MSEIKYNKSSFCIMPLLGIDRNELYWKFFFLNCYIGITEYPELDDHFFLLFKFKNKQAYLTTKEKIVGSNLFDKEMLHTTASGDYHIFVYSIPENNKKDVALFKLGKYSQMSREHKNTIMRVHLVKQDKPLFHILNKTKQRRIKLSEELNYDIPENLDLWDIPYIHDEILTLNNLK